jgi:hypothetical protein
MIGFILKWVAIGVFIWVGLVVGNAFLAGYVSATVNSGPVVEEARKLPPHDWNNPDAFKEYK